MIKFLSKFRRDEEGATAIEYGLIAALIAIALIASLTLVGTSLSGIFTEISEEIDTASPST